MATLRPDLAEKLASGKLTPMMRQYLSVKAEYPHALILFRMGDFFETFYDDAEAAAELLDLTLTKRSKEKDAPPMAGVPHHAIGGYITRLVELGRTVVMVDQVEDPKQAKGLVRREVTRVFSPGTFVDPNAPARSPAYLVGLAFGAKRKAKMPSWGLAALDIATGEFRATSGQGGDAAVDEIARLGAREVLIVDSTHPIAEQIGAEVEQVVLTERPAGRGRAALVDRLGEAEVAALGNVLESLALDAADMALEYAGHTQMRAESFEAKKGGSLGHIDSLQPYLPGDALILDAEARVHLELFVSAGSKSKKGALIGVIDQAVTSMGGRLLYRWLARPLNASGPITRRLDAVADLVASPSRLDEIRQSFKQVHDLERLVGRVVMGRSTPRDLAALRGSLLRLPAVFAESAAATSSALIEGGDPSLLANLASTDPCVDVAEDLGTALVELPPNEFGSERVFAEGYDADLDELIALTSDAKQVLADMETHERKQTGITSLKVRYNRVFGYFIEVTKANLDAVPSHYVRKQTMVNAERYYTVELKDLEDRILHANERRNERESALFLALVGRVAEQSKRLRAAAEAVAALDALSALAFIADRRGWCRPDVDDSDVLDIVDGRHPVLDELSAELGERFVPNDVTLGDPERLMIVTGPNMAGKSTIMRQTALITILGHMGSFVPARTARIGVVDRVFTRVGASDDLSRGRSTFMVEMTETARILRSATARSLILLDEIGRGTSTFDGLSIAWAVAEHIHDVVQAKTMFATHYHELTEICRDKPLAANHHVAVRQYNDQIVFLRKLLPGPTNRSYGVQVARLAGLPEEVVQRARGVLSSLEEHDLSAGVSKRRRRQLQLFTPARGPALDPVAAEVLDALQSIDVDDITPRDALAKIAQWQAGLTAGKPD